MYKFFDQSPARAYFRPEGPFSAVNRPERIWVRVKYFLFRFCCFYYLRCILLCRTLYFYKRQVVSNVQVSDKVQCFFNLSQFVLLMDINYLVSRYLEVSAYVKSFLYSPDFEGSFACIQGLEVSSVQFIVFQTECKKFKPKECLFLHTTIWMQPQQTFYISRPFMQLTSKASKKCSYSD